jgi:hypothetical protein
MVPAILSDYLMASLIGGVRHLVVSVKLVWVFRVIRQTRPGWSWIMGLGIMTSCLQDIGWRPVMTPYILSLVGALLTRDHTAATLYFCSLIWTFGPRLIRCIHIRGHTLHHLEQAV